MTETQFLERHIQFRRNGTDHVNWFASPVQAIDAACAFIDEGNDVYGIGIGSLDGAIEKDQIAKIYEIWMKTNEPLDAVSPDDGPHA
jgi:hypothetical protein